MAVDGNFAKDDTMTMNSIGDWRFQIDRGDSADDEKVQTGITGAWLTDYPFDSYDASIALTLTDSDGNDVPTAITVLNTDSFYKIETVQADASDGGTLINLTIRRSTSTLVFGIFIMVLMLALAAARRSPPITSCTSSAVWTLSAAARDGKYAVRADPVAQRGAG